MIERLENKKGGKRHLRVERGDLGRVVGEHEEQAAQDAGLAVDGCRLEPHTGTETTEGGRGKEGASELEVIAVALAFPDLGVEDATAAVQGCKGR